MSYLHTKFHDNWISSFRGVVMTRFWDGRTDGWTDGRSDCTPRPAFAFGEAGKKGAIPRKKNWIKISCGYAHLHIMSFITRKFHEILLSGFRGVALTRKTGLTEGQTDWLTDRSKTLYPPQLVVWGIKIYKTVSNLCKFIFHGLGSGILAIFAENRCTQENTNIQFNLKWKSMS